MKAYFDKFILLTGRLFRFDTLYLLKGSFWVWGVYVLVILLGLLQTVAFSRWVPKEIFGQFQLFLALFSIFAIFYSPGTNTAFSRSVAKGFDKSFFAAFKDQLKWSVLGNLAFVGAAVYVWKLFPGRKELALALLVAGIFYQLHQVLSNVFSYYYAKKDFKTPSIYNFFSKLFSVSAVVMALFLTRGLLWPSAAYVISVSAVNTFAYFRFLKKERFNGQSEEGVVKEGRKLTLLGVIPTLSNNFEQLAISYFIGLPQLADYTIASKFADTAKNFFNLWGNLLFPKFVHLGKAAFLGKLRNVWIWSSGILLTAIIIVALPLLIPLVFGSAYTGVVRLAQLYTLVLVPRVMQRVIQNWAPAQGELPLYFKITNLLRIADVVITVAVVAQLQTLFALVMVRVVNAFLLAGASALLVLALKPKKESEPPPVFT